MRTLTNQREWHLNATLQVVTPSFKPVKTFQG